MRSPAYMMSVNVVLLFIVIFYRSRCPALRGRGALALRYFVLDFASHSQPEAGLENAPWQRASELRVTSSFRATAAIGLSSRVSWLRSIVRRSRKRFCAPI
jgi:hypothetical protein